MDPCIWMAESLLCLPETIPTLLVGYTPIENKKLKEEVQKKQNQFFYGALIGGAGGVVVTSLVFSLIMGACK